MERRATRKYEERSDAERRKRLHTENKRKEKYQRPMSLRGEGRE